MLKQLLSDAQAAVLCSLELSGPVVDGSVELDESFFLLKKTLLGKYERLALQIADKTIVKFLSARSQ